MVDKIYVVRRRKKEPSYEETRLIIEEMAELGMVRIIHDFEKGLGYVVTEEFFKEVLERAKKEFGEINEDSVIHVLVRIVPERYRRIIPIGTKENPIDEQELITRVGLLWSTIKKALIRRGLLDGNFL